MTKHFKLWGAVIAASLFLCAEASAMTVTEFYALAQQQKGINAFAATVQSAIETGHWTSPLWKNTFNGAGLKAPPAWRKSKPYVAIKSPESNGATYCYRVSYFRKYHSPSEFLSDYAQKIKSDYPRCTQDNLWGYFAGLYRGRLGKWATDHRYFELLTRQAVKLAPVLLGDSSRLKAACQNAVERGLLEPWQIAIVKQALEGK